MYMMGVDYYVAGDLYLPVYGGEYPNIIERCDDFSFEKLAEE